ncbi:MAG: metallophosphoesterase [Clostridia bacterium]|nr:metallophosphoesterase [Clostridia bacterium]
MVYLISDIHGDYDLFVKLLKKINFSKEDKMIVVGDMLDKGKKSVKLLELFFGEYRNNFECVMGNHEHNFLKYYNKLQEVDIYTEDQIVQHCNDYADIEDGFSIEFIKNLEVLPYFIEKEDYICVHAGVPLDENDVIKNLEEAEIEELIYDRSFKAPLILPMNSKCVVFGHTPTIYLGGDPEIIAYKKEGAKGDKMSDYHKIHLDTGSYLTGVLGCWCVDECKPYYVHRWE